MACIGKGEMMYVYQRFEPGCYTVGFYTPKGEWEPESDHSTREEAASRVHYLNGSSDFLSEALNSGDGVYRP